MMHPKWKISVPPVDMPTADAIRERNPGAVDGPQVTAWRRFVLSHGGRVKADAEYEDWAEMACRLEAGLRLLPDPVVVIRRFGADIILDPVSAEPVEADLEGLPQLGPVMSPPSSDALFIPSDGSVDSYHLLEPVTSRLNREHHAVDVDMDALLATMTDMLSRHDAIWIKNMIRTKSMMTRVTADEVRDGNGVITPESIMRGFPQNEWEALSWETVRHEGDASMLFVQEDVDMTHETRFFVIDGRPVTGAASIIENTPLDNHGRRFDDATALYRSDTFPDRHPDDADPSALTMKYRDPSVIDGMLPFVRSAARDISKVLDVGYYVMDVCLIDGSPSIVELNSAGNAGLFAIDIDALVSAMAACPDIPIPVGEGGLHADPIVNASPAHDPATDGGEPEPLV